MDFSDADENYLSYVPNSPCFRKAYSNKFKQQVIEFKKLNGCSLQNTALHFGISESLVSRCAKLSYNYFEIKNLTSKRLCAGRSPEYPELEVHLYDAIVDVRKKGGVVKYKKMKQMAKNIASCKNIDTSGLKMTDNWIYRFCQRYGLCDRSKTHTAQECLKSPLDQCIIVSSYLRSIKNISSTYNPSFIFNMDETPVYMDMPGFFFFVKWSREQPLIWLNLF
jgi:hypothetical protein